MYSDAKSEVSEWDGYRLGFEEKSCSTYSEWRFWDIAAIFQKH